MKVVFPTFWIGMFSLGTLMLFVMDPVAGTAREPAPGFLRWLLLGTLIVGTIAIYFTCMGLKRVSIDATALHVSNYLTEITIPLAEVTSVSENKWINIRPVTITFATPTEFGRRITFMPRAQLLLWHSHPVVAELEQAAAKARGLPAQQSEAPDKARRSRR